MAVNTGDIERVLVRNIRIPRAEFGAVWDTADRSRGKTGDVRSTDWYLTGVAVTCMWLAEAIHTPAWSRPQPAPSPVGDREVRTYEESIEAEYLAAELMAAHQPWLLE